MAQRLRPVGASEDPNPITQAAIRRSIWDKTDGKCWYCGIQTKPWLDFEVDHYLPRNQGGTDELSNLVPTCHRCNSTKGPRSPEYLRHKLGISRFYFEQLEAS